MNKIQYEFVRLIENSVQTPVKTQKGEILVWLEFDQLQEFSELVGNGYLCKGDTMVNLRSDCVVVDIKDILEYLDIDEDVVECEEE